VAWGKCPESLVASRPMCEAETTFASLTEIRRGAAPESGPHTDHRRCLVSIIFYFYFLFFLFYSGRIIR
jgi:hypothetical protein